MKKTNFLLSLVAATLATIWFFSYSYREEISIILDIFLEGNTRENIICSSKKSNCVKKVSVRNGIGSNYTTEVYVFFNRLDSFSAGSLPENCIIFEPETFVEIKWVTEDTIDVSYEGGDYQIIGKIPNSVTINFLKQG
ncbi:hypothetical protein [Cohaesibacter marisflavi]|nr:hypothetical protein [Cohaesibacter marisflavi]